MPPPRPPPPSPPFSPPIIASMVCWNSRSLSSGVSAPSVTITRFCTAPSSTATRRSSSPSSGSKDAAGMDGPKWRRRAWQRSSAAWVMSGVACGEERPVIMSSMQRPPSSPLAALCAMCVMMVFMPMTYTSRDASCAGSTTRVGQLLDDLARAVAADLLHQQTQRLHTDRLHVHRRVHQQGEQAAREGTAAGAPRGKGSRAARAPCRGRRGP